MFTTPSKAVSFSSKFLFLLFLFFLPCFLPAQETTGGNQLQVKTRTLEEQIEIRWAPVDHLLWSLANRQGYRLERKEKDGTWKILLDRGPYSVDQFKENLDTTNAHVATAAQAVYGKAQAQILGLDPFAEAKAVEEEQRMRHMFALLAADYNTEAADGLALRYVDRDFPKGATMLYRVFVRSGDPLEFTADTSYFMVNTNRIYQAQAVGKVFAEPEAGAIILKWAKTANVDYFSGYFVERSEDNGKTFQRLNETPLLTSDHDEFDEFNTYHIYADKAVKAGSSYQYQIIGVTPFGDEGLPSESITSRPIDNSGPMPPTSIDARDIGENRIRINWEATSTAPDHKGFLVTRSAHPTGPFYPLQEKPLSTKVREFIDDNPIPVKANYYIVYAIDDKGNRNGSPVIMAQWFDDTPPAQPENLAGFIDTSGIVTLAWNWGKEADLLGYRVYWSNGPDREFYQLTDKPVEGSIYLDSINLKTLSETIYYKIVAVDYNMNPSKPSEVLPVKRPDMNPPASPLISNYQSFPDSIRIDWQPSPSEDVVVYRLLRKELGAEKYDVLIDITNLDQQSYTDRNINPGTTYEYAIVVIDDARLYSDFSNSIQIHALRGAKRPAIHNLNGRIDESNATFQLEWDYQSAADYQFSVYRKVDDEGWKSVAHLEKDQMTYTDRHLYLAEKGFAYAVKVVFADGGESPLSNEVQLNLKR